MKKYFRSFCCFVSLLMFSLFLFSCKHKEDESVGVNPTPDPVLVLDSMMIHGETVIDRKVSIREETIKSENITAFFKYGKINKEITCIIEGGEFTLDKTKPKKLTLRVEEVKGKYQAWSDVFEVSYKAEQLKSLYDELVLNVNDLFNKEVQGLEDKMLPEGFIEGLKNSTIPELKVYDSRAPLAVLYRAKKNEDENIMGDVEFDINGKKTIEKPTQPNQSLAIWKADFLAEFTNKDTPLVVTITVKPKDKKKFEDAVYKFSLKSTGTMPVLVGYNGQYHQNGGEETLDVDVAEFVVQCYRDVINTVTITDGKATHTPQVKKYKNAQDIDFWSANQKMALNKSLTTYTITITPKNTSLYNNAVYTYKLRGKAVPQDNAEFVYRNGEPKVQGELTFRSGCESKYINSFGCTKIKIFTSTVSPKATVHYKMIDPITKNLAKNHGLTVVQGTLTSDGLGEHQGEITVLEDKPTHLMLYVVAEDGVTQDSTKGRTILILNEMDLFHDVDEANLAKRSKRKTAAEKAYDTVEIDKTKVSANGNKFYLCFTCLPELFGTKVADSVKNMEGFKKLDKWASYQAYQVTVDASKLISAEKSEIELDIPLLRTLDDDSNPINPPVESFTYKVKIKLAE